MLQRIILRRPLMFVISLVSVFVLFLIISVAGPAISTKLRTASNPAGHTLADSLLPPAFAGFNSNFIRIFNDYTSWPTSVALKTDDTLPQTLTLLAKSLNISNTSTQIDINGDGLTDVLYHNATPNNYPQNFGVFLNKGNLQFDLAYKCAYTVVSNIPHYYGDCADTASTTNMLLPNIFSGFAAWPTSTALKTTDSLPIVLQLLTPVFNATKYQTIADINGDGFADILFHDGSSTTTRNYGIFLSKGNLQYDLAYKCVYNNVSNIPHWYGDCADTTSTAQTSPPYFNWSSWPHTTTLNANDTMAQTLFYMSNPLTGSSGDRYSSMTDMNGDGLPDIVLHNVPSYMPYEYDFAVYFNKGNLQFEQGYKCAYADPDGFGPITTWNYYGDCAG